MFIYTKLLIIQIKTKIGRNVTLDIVNKINNIEKINIGDKLLYVLKNSIIRKN